MADCGTQRQPTPADVALALDIPEATARRAMEWIEQPISLDYAVGEDGEATIGDFVAAADNTEADASAAVLRDEVRRLVASIADERARRIIVLRFGLESGEPMTLEAIGCEMGITRERVRQVERDTLSQLRHPARGGRLRGWTR